jgi:signal transduction histidine kinase
MDGSTRDMDRRDGGMLTADRDDRELAESLHDSVLQTLFSLHLAIQVAQDNVEREPAQARRALEMALRLTRDAVTGLRSLLFDLHENALESDGLACTLEKYTDQLCRHGNLQIRLVIPPALSLPTRYQESLFRLVQEGLTNVVKHAHAGHATVAITADEMGIGLRIEDDGIGFARAEPERESCALWLLRERVHKLGGTLRLGNGPQGGAYVAVALPTPEKCG